MSSSPLPDGLVANPEDDGTSLLKKIHRGNSQATYRKQSYEFINLSSIRNYLDLSYQVDSIVDNNTQNFIVKTNGTFLRKRASGNSK